VIFLFFRIIALHFFLLKIYLSVIIKLFIIIKI